jgi:hypothetical protein
MSNQSEAKTAQGYTRDRKVCGNCTYIRSDIRTKMLTPVASTWKEYHIRCSIGGFGVHKTATCNFHEAQI